MKDYSSAKKALNGVLAFLSACKFLLLLTSLLSGTVLLSILKIFLGNDAEIALETFNSYDSLAGLLFNIAVSILCLFVPIALYFVFTGRRLRDTASGAAPEFLQICYGVGATVTIGNVTASASNTFFLLLFTVFGMEEKFYALAQSDTTYPTTLWGAVLFAILLAVLPGFLEEVVMRGISLNVTKRLGTAFSLVFSGFFFGLMHSSFLQLPYAFVLGIVLAYFTLKFKTIWIAIISHFLFNFSSAIQALILQNCGDYGTLLSVVWMLLFNSLMTGLFVAGLIVYGVKKPDNPKSEFSFGEKMKMLFTSPFLYVFCVTAIAHLILILVLI